MHHPGHVCAVVTVAQLQHLRDEWVMATAGGAGGVGARAISCKEAFLSHF